LINAAHDVSDGGLYVTLVEMSIPSDLGFDILTDAEIRGDAFLFGEGQGRVVVTMTEEMEGQFIEFMLTQNVNITLLGHVTKGKMQVDEEHFGFISEAKAIYQNALGELLENKN
jgi:phosphoribosylformylglycinamidine synthase